MKQQSGAVLIIVWLFLLVMGWLIFANTESRLLNSKITHYFYEKQIVNEAAEAGLLQGESIIQQKSKPLFGTPAKLTIQIHLISEDLCHKKRYQIISHAIVEKTQTTLESLYDYLPEPTAKCASEKINRRVHWQLKANH